VIEFGHHCRIFDIICDVVIVSRGRHCHAKLKLIRMVVPEVFRVYQSACKTQSKTPGKTQGMLTLIRVYATQRRRHDHLNSSLTSRHRPSSCLPKFHLLPSPSHLYPIDTIHTIRTRLGRSLHLRHQFLDTSPLLIPRTVLST
jgi:hypothetical protein